MGKKLVARDVAIATNTQPMMKVVAIQNARRVTRLNPDLFIGTSYTVNAF